MHNDLSIADIEDLKIALSYNGGIIGKIGSCKIKEFFSQFEESFINSISILHLKEILFNHFHY